MSVTFNIPKHRILTYNSLEDFYLAGFRYLPVEAHENDSCIINFGFHQISSGYYTAEPNMGNLLKKAIRLA